MFSCVMFTFALCTKNTGGNKLYNFIFMCLFILCFYFERCSRKAFLFQPTPRLFSVNGPSGSPGAMHRLLLVFVAAVGPSVLGLPRLVASRAAEPCVAPLQWEGRWVVYDHSTGRNSRAAVSYDGVDQRIRVLQQHKKHTPCQR